MDTSVDYDDGVMAAKYTGDFLVQVVQGVAVLAEDYDFPHPPTCVAHLGFVLEDAREFVPLAILAGGDKGFGLLFEDLEATDFIRQFGDGARSGGLRDQYFEVFRVRLAILLFTR